MENNDITKNYNTNKNDFSLQDKSENKPKKKSFLFKILAGAVLGLVNGFFGGGGGMICVPILSRFFNLKKQSAHASSIAVILPLSLVSGIVYLTKNEILIKNILIAGFALAIGGGIGAVFLKKIPQKVLRIIFAFLMFFAGLSMVIL
jgi:uncharacterized membrane protein YfcA